jgi:hypothetical protein
LNATRASAGSSIADTAAPAVSAAGDHRGHSSASSPPNEQASHGTGQAERRKPGERADAERHRSQPSTQRQVPGAECEYADRADRELIGQRPVQQAAHHVVAGPHGHQERPERLREHDGEQQWDHGCESAHQDPARLRRPTGTGEYDEARQQQQGKPGQRPDESVGIAEVGTHEPEMDEVVVRAEAGNVGVAECTRKREHGLAVVLQAARLQVGDRVARGVVARSPVDEGEVHAHETRSTQRAEVAAVRQCPVELAQRRVTPRMRDRRGVQPDDARVARRCLEHQRRAVDATRLPVEDDPTVAGQRMLPDEGLGTDRPVLLPIGDQQDQVVAQLRIAAQRSHGLQQRRDRRTVVRCTRSHRGGVVMRGEHHRAGRVPSRERRHDVVHPAEGRQPGRGTHTHRVLDLDLQSRSA